MIYTLTLNPAIDYCLKPARLVPGEINSCDWSCAYPGGKGINVSRVLRQLDTVSTALGFIAGFSGEAVRQMLHAQAIKTDFIVLPKGLTRINVKIRCGEETDINCLGPEIDDTALRLLMNRLSRLKAGDLLVLAGSLPAGLPENVYELVLESIKDRGVTVAADTAGLRLAGIARYRPFVVKPNHLELGEIFGKTAETESEILEQARCLQDMGARNVLVSAGEKGALLLVENGKVYSAPLFAGTAVNTVGAGDSMLAGFLCGYLRTGNMEEALKLGAAAGAATAFSDDLADRTAIDRLLQSL